MKLVCDGSLSERTARLQEPYVGRPDDFGILVMEEEEMLLHARKAHAAGWQIGTHCNGDFAIDQTLRVYERLQKELPRKDPRFRLEHCSLINDNLVQRIRKAGAIQNFILHLRLLPRREDERVRARPPEPHVRGAQLLNAGVKVTQASDYPAVER
jgi:predicted amidohydrolase YtcJ